MLIKKADDQSALIRNLEQRAAGTGLESKRASDELRIRKAGLKGESDSAYLIDFNYSRSPNWAVIHDLRLEHGGRVAQIDHVMINRFMDVYVLETKHFHSGIKITKDGEFLRWTGRNFAGIPSPLEQNERHIAVLRDVMESIDLPVRLGVRIPPSFQSYVLVAPSARIDRSRGFDASRVIKADQLKSKLGKDMDDEHVLVTLFKATKIVSAETTEFVARQLASLHRPLHGSPGPQPTAREPGPCTRAGRIRVEPAFSTSRTPATPDAPACRKCGENKGLILYGNSYYFKCGACETNTPMRQTCKPGHTPRLRKRKQEFFRDCPECGTSTLYHTNPETEA